MQYILNNHVLKIILLLDVIYWGVNNNNFVWVLNLTYVLIYILYYNNLNALLYAKIIYGNITTIFLFDNIVVYYTSFFPSTIPTYFITLVLSMICNMYFIQKRSLNIIICIFLIVYVCMSFTSNIYFIVIHIYLILALIACWTTFQYPLSFNKFLIQNYVELNNINLKMCELLYNNQSILKCDTLQSMASAINATVYDGNDTKLYPKIKHLMVFLYSSNCQYYIKVARLNIRSNSIVIKYLMLNNIPFTKKKSQIIVNACLI